MILRVKEFMNYNPTHHWFFVPSLQGFGLGVFADLRPRFESPSPDVTFGWSPLETGGTDPNPAEKPVVSSHIEVCFFFTFFAGTLTHL